MWAFLEKRVGRTRTTQVGDCSKGNRAMSHKCKQRGLKVKRKISKQGVGGGGKGESGQHGKEISWAKCSYREPSLEVGVVREVPAEDRFKQGVKR